MEYQKTISKEVSLSGFGLHTGNPTKLKFIPAPTDYGIKFVRTDLPNGDIVIPAVSDNVLGVIRGTTIGINNILLYTVEHVLAAIYGLGIDNIQIQIDNNEPPVFDGSSRQFVKCLVDTGIVEQDKPKKYLKITEPIVYKSEDNSVEICAYPCDELKIDGMINYQHPLVGKQEMTLTITPETFINEISCARTFCFDYEIEALKKKGLAKGGNLENTIVIGITGIHNAEKLRYENEFLRHKLLDFIGDISLLDRPILAHIVYKYSGHKHNINFVKKILDNYKRGKPDMTNRELDISEIKKVIPHREPFLMIDRVVIGQEEKSATGFKHLTGNEDFFRGHFPGNPIMPGVLIIEALAQTAGVLFLSRPDLRDKLPYFMSIEKAKFRKPVLPGNTIELKIEVLRAREHSGKVRGVAYVNNEIVTELEFMFILVDKEK